MASYLSKEILIHDYKVTNVTEDGTVYVKDKLRRPINLSRKTKYMSTHVYKGICVMHNGKRRSIPLARLMCAWFYGEIAEDMDADHIDGDTLNNNINNLQIISHRANMHKRAKTWKEIASDWMEMKQFLALKTVVVNEQEWLKLREIILKEVSTK